MRIQSRTPLYLSEHLDRLAGSCRLLGLPAPCGQLPERLRMAAAQHEGSGVLRVQLGHGVELIRTAPFGGERWGAPLSLASLAPAELDLAIATAKHCSRGHWERGAAARGADELLWIDAQGQLLETHQGNVFVQVGDRLVTPPLDGRILPGVTRGALLAAARDAGLIVEVRPVSLTEAQAVWVSSSLKGLAPVTSIDGERWPVGELGAPLLQALEQREAARAL